MKKVRSFFEQTVLKEFTKPIYAIDAVLYGIFVVLGFILLNFSEIGLNDPTKYAPFLFYGLAFFIILAYFLNRRKGDYELLLFGLINVIVATFILINMYGLAGRYVMSDAVLIYSIAIVINKGIACQRLLESKNINFFAKIAVTILLLILGVFVVSSLYNKIEVGILILGYYFIIFGLLSLLEPLMAILSQNKAFEDYMFEVLAYDREEKEDEEPIKKKSKTVSKSNKSIKNRTIKKIKK